MSMAGKVAVVTGASRGIGFAVAESLVNDGASVVITARGAEALEQAVSRLGGRAAGLPGKLSDPTHREALLDLATSRFGGVDYLVNNVGINPVYGPMVEIDSGAARKILEVNVLDAFELSRAAVAAGLRERRGSIVNISSIAGVAASPMIGMYGVSKAALLGLTRQLAAELAPHVRVNSVAPAAVKTQFARALYENREAELVEKYPLRRLGVPADVAGPVHFLLSDAAGWVTGQNIVIDGGASLLIAE